VARVLRFAVRNKWSSRPAVRPLRVSCVACTTPRLLIAATVTLAALAACSAPPAAPSASGPRIYVSDETGTEVVVVDPVAGKVLQKIAIGKRPRGLKLSPDASQLFVALSGSPIGGPGVDESKLPPADRAADGIGVIDVASGSVVRKIQERPGSGVVRGLERRQDALRLERGRGRALDPRPRQRHREKNR